MTNPLDQLNLRPQEKRVLVVVSFLIFVALNFWLVRPLFGKFGAMQTELEKSRRTLAKYQEEVAKAPDLERQENQMKELGAQVLTEELALSRIVQNQAVASSVLVGSYTPATRASSGRTNQFFEDQGLNIDFTTGGKELVDFLVGLASGNSMIRVQDMRLGPDTSGTKLKGNILFVASYQKKAPAAAAPTMTSGAAPRPAAPKPTNTPVAKATNAPAAKPAAAANDPKKAAAGKTNSAAKK